VRHAARRSAIDAQAGLQKRVGRERRLERLAVEVLPALGERDGAVRNSERRAGGALLAMTDEEGLSVRSRRIVRQRRHIAGSDRRRRLTAQPSAVVRGERGVSAAYLAALPENRSDGAGRWRPVSRMADSSLSVAVRLPALHAKMVASLPSPSPDVL
jgi:hypothetical protein